MVKFALILILTLISVGSPSFASDKNDREVLEKCLKAWKKNPFRKNPDYRRLESGTNVLGVGGTVEDNEETKSPQLILVEPSVSVLSSTTLKLMNPNGWYCLKSKVDVLSKSTIELHCKANLATSGGKTTVLGNDPKGEGVTILGKAEIKRVDCETK